ncbi:MAG: methylmalonyl Co-A mutase-associated GTPase MeaB [Flammeovirgaceae bacterium]
MRRLSEDAYVAGIQAGDRLILSRAITLVESQREKDVVLAQQVLGRLTHQTERTTIRIGITGSPGVGKSTFIEAFGKYLTSIGKKVAVLAVDPSSQRTKGSIMGDKTRMEELVKDPLAYIRPSASGSTLGGVARKTRESILLCEAAGYEVIIVETVGVGQSEVAVKEMTDFFLLLMLAGAGDELQGIKKGIMEMTDAIAITKADGDNVKQAKRARVEYLTALHLFPANPSGWIPKVLTCSALENQHIDQVWEVMVDFQTKLTTNGWLQKNREAQNLHWMHDTIKERLITEFYQHARVQQVLANIEHEVASGQQPAYAAALKLLNLFKY